MAWYQLVFFILTILSLLGSVMFGIRARTHKDPLARGLFAARTNICMGALLLSVVALQLLDFKMSWVRLFVLVLFGLLGLFNLFAGLRSHAQYSRRRPG